MHLVRAAFDETAAGYDAEFTETRVGRLQRAVTHRFLSQFIDQHRPRTVLELNCGTGEDARWLAGRGLEVTATDLSGGMLAATEAKVPGLGVRTLRCGIEELDRLLPHERYDLIWSNFGGFNCLDAAAVKAASGSIHRLLRPRGHFVAVVMGRFCAWETAYFLAKLRLGQAFRRLRRGPVPARLADGHYQDTFYYSPAAFERLFAPRLQPVRRLAVGAYLPPSYLDPFFARRPALLARMARKEEAAFDRPFAAQFSDHFLVAFQRQ